MEQLFFAGRAYLKINSLVKTQLHEFMAVERSGLWAPGRKTSKCFKTFTFLLTLLSLINGQTGVSCRSTERKTQNDSRNVIMRNLCLGHKINVALFLAFTNLFVVCF